MELRERRHWIFDLDGTVTRAQHDFDDLRRRLGLPEGAPILETLREREPEVRRRAEAQLEGWEWAHAERAELEPDAGRLIDALEADGAHLAVLTRNRRVIAVRTLEVIGYS